jgi:diguanylate cyclase (GGDEF)-like protein
VLVIAIVLITGIVTGYLSIKANTKYLALSYLDSNSQYAKKLASDATIVLTNMRNNLEYIAATAATPSFGQKELDMLYNGNQQYFNSILYVNADRVVKGISPSNAGSVGTRLSSDQSIRANQARKTLISEPYMAATGRLIVLISSPVFDENGVYAGFVGGTIYLEQDNVLSRVLNEHFYGNGSYLFVVDDRRHLIFHPDKRRINEIVWDNDVVDKVLMKQRGSERVVNSKGKSFFAGYAYEPISGWGIVSQTPTSVMSAPLQKLIIDSVWQELPLLILILLIAWFVAHRISKPLYKLAKYSEEAILFSGAVPANLPETNSRIYEVNRLYERFNNHLHLLNEEIQLDGMTGLANRKTFDFTIKEWVQSKVPFSLIFLDVDHFKSINDHQGHLMGDEVIKYLSLKMGSCSRQQDLCFRYGGDEFGILVHKGNDKTSVHIAERLVQELAQEKSPTGQEITVSVGISFYTGGLEKPLDIIESADAALYVSKTEGRNRITIASSAA